MQDVVCNASPLIFLIKEEVFIEFLKKLKGVDS